jgi:hypothetical protein
MSAELPIDFLICLNQGLQEEQRLIRQIKAEAQRIDEELDYKYHKLLDSMIKMNILTKSVKTKNASFLVEKFDKDTKFLIKQVDDLHIYNNNLLESVLQLMKKHPSYLLDYLESCAPEELANFMNELPSFYFDYSEINSYSEFLKIFFTRKRDKGGFIDYNKQHVTIMLIRISSHCSTP